MGRKAYQKDRCSCGEPVTFVPSESTGRLAPIEDRPDDAGNVVLVRATADGAARRDDEEERSDGDHDDDGPR